MIESLHNVDENFYKVFLGQGFTTNTLTLVTHRGKTVVIPIVYARASAYDRAENPLYVIHSLPTISILNYSPEIINEWVDMYFKNYFGGLDVVAGSDIETIIYEFSHGIPLRMKYDVNFASKSESEFTAIKDYFFKNFDVRTQSSFIFNRIDVPLDDVLARDTSVGDPVYYDMNMTDVPRTDGVFQGVTTFVIQAWVDSKDPIAHEIVKQVIVDLQVKTI